MPGEAGIDWARCRRRELAADPTRATARSELNSNPCLVAAWLWRSEPLVHVRAFSVYRHSCRGLVAGVVDNGQRVMMCLTDCRLTGDQLVRDSDIRLRANALHIVEN